MRLHRGWVLENRGGRSGSRITMVDPVKAAAAAAARAKKAERLSGRAERARLSKEVRTASLAFLGKRPHMAQSDLAKVLQVSKFVLNNVLSESPTCLPSIEHLKAMLEKLNTLNKESNV